MVATIVVVALLFAVVMKGLRSGPPPVPRKTDEWARYRAIVEKYRGLRDTLHANQFEAKTAVAWKQNLDGSLHALQVMLIDDPSPGRVMVRLPAAACTRLLQANGISEPSLFQEFIAEHGTNVLLDGADAAAALSAIEAFAERRLAAVTSIGWPALVAPLSDQKDADKTWFGQAIRMLRRQSVMAPDVPDRNIVCILVLPESTPDTVQSKVQLNLPPGNTLVRVGADEVVLVQMAQAAPTPGFAEAVSAL